eukprot:5305272-Alexandrium_andersonii.AAC.1
MPHLPTTAGIDRVRSRELATSQTRNPQYRDPQSRNPWALTCEDAKFGSDGKNNQPRLKG